jgi:hypothetical protein
MGNINSSKKYYNSHYSSLDEDQIKNIRKNYKVIDVDWLDKTLVDSKMFHDEYFTKSPKKKEVVNNILHHYLHDKDEHNIHIYKMTDYLCDDRERVCICNTHADDFRKIYEGINYKKDSKYISWLETKSR